MCGNSLLSQICSDKKLSEVSKTADGVYGTHCGCADRIVGTDLFEALPKL